MIREDGYYWVKLNDDSAWVVARFISGGLFVTEWSGFDFMMRDDNHFIEINENRIYNPDELSLGPPIAILKNDSKTVIVRGTSELDDAEAHTEVKESVENKAIESLLSRDDLPTTIAGLNFWLNNEFISKDAYFEILKTIKDKL